MLNIGNLLISNLDYILIVDKNYKIIYNTRYDALINDKSTEYVWGDVMGKNFFDVYPSVPREQCSISQCMETREVIVNKNQEYFDYLGRRFVTNNVTIPLTRKGQLVAVAELAMDAPEGTDDTFSVAENARFEEFVSRLKQEAGLITFDTILTVNPQMKASIERAQILAKMPNPTLIYGETGTGKELFAQSMISCSNVSDKKVVIQNCAAVPEGLLESILFGAVKGSYTGSENITGLFEQADGGILFLDELNSIPYGVQSKLLRVIQDGTFRPIGARNDKHVNVKVIAAMNIDPVEAINSQVLRNDLFYRFSSGLINLLPLRERKEDITLYIKYFTEYFSSMYGKSVAGVSEEVKQLFYEYEWPGNVREIKNTIESMVVTAKPGEELDVGCIPSYIMEQFSKIQKTKMAEDAKEKVKNELCKKLEAECEENLEYHQIMDTLEKELIMKALEKAGGSRGKAAKILGLPRNTLKYRLDKFNL